MQTLQDKLYQYYDHESVDWAMEHAQHILGAEDLPPTITDEETGKVLGVKPATVVVWRCTGDKHIACSKVGRSALNSTLSVLRLLLDSGSNRMGVA